jgi:hypothetical protein
VHCASAARTSSPPQETNSSANRTPKCLSIHTLG